MRTNWFCRRVAKRQRPLIATTSFTKQRSGFTLETNVNSFPLSKLFWKGQRRFTILVLPKFLRDFLASIRFFPLDKKMMSSIVEVVGEPSMCFLKVLFVRDEYGLMLIH